MSERHYYIDKWAREVGVKFMVAEVHGVEVRKNSPEVTDLVSQTVSELLEVAVDSEQILQGYRKLFAELGIENAVASPEWLHQLISNYGKLPRINTVVDVYNVVSAKRFIVASAHDLSAVEGDVGIQQTIGSEVFYPLGQREAEILPPDEWAGVANNHILCRLNCKQSELSKVTTDTTDLLVYVQGNRVTCADYLTDSLAEICEQLVLYNGGTFHLLPERRL